MGDTLPPRRGHAWKECHVEDERLRFVARLLDGENDERRCAPEFGISRKTGYKMYDRYKEVGSRVSPTGVDGRTGTPISCRWCSSRRSSG
jgi:hypothetical protein